MTLEQFRAMWPAMAMKSAPFCLICVSKVKAGIAMTLLYGSSVLMKRSTGFSRKMDGRGMAPDLIRFSTSPLIILSACIGLLC